MIMMMFPNKLPSKIKQKTQRLENLSAGESKKEHVEFIWSCTELLEISGTFVMFHNNMMQCCTSTTLSMLALKIDTLI